MNSQHVVRRRRRRFVQRAAWPAAMLLAGAALLAACLAPAGGTVGGDPAPLFVANGLDGTVTRLDAWSGRPLGPALPAGSGPARLVPGPHGSLLVAGASQGGLTYIAPAGDGWVTRPLRLEPEPGPYGVQLAGDGGRYAAAAYHVWEAGLGHRVLSCRLALIDLHRGAVERTHVVCPPRDLLFALALQNTAGGPIAYLGLWRRPVAAEVEVDGPRVPGSGRIVAIAAATGAVLTVSPVAGMPAELVLARAPERSGQRLHYVEAVADRDVLDSFLERSEAEVAAVRWQVLGLHPATLDIESVQALDQRPASLSLSPDGEHAYLLDGETSLLHLDLAQGAVTHFATLPKPAAARSGLAVTRDRVYVPDSLGSAVWAIERHSGRVVHTIPVGRRPLGIALGSTQ